MCFNVCCSHSDHAVDLRRAPLRHTQQLVRSPVCPSACCPSTVNKLKITKEKGSCAKAQTQTLHAHTHTHTTVSDLPACQHTQRLPLSFDNLRPAVSTGGCLSNKSAHAGALSWGQRAEQCPLSWRTTTHTGNYNEIHVSPAFPNL